MEDNLLAYTVKPAVYVTSMSYVNELSRIYNSPLPDKGNLDHQKTGLCGFECDKMPLKNVTLNVDEDSYNNYREFRKEKGWIMSRHSEIMMEEQMRIEAE